MAKVFDRIKVATSTVGTGSLTLGAAEPGFRTFIGGGAVDGDTVSYVIEDGIAWEIGYGQLGGGGSVLNRIVISSSNANALIALTGNAKVFNGMTKAELDAKAGLGFNAFTDGQQAPYFYAYAADASTVEYGLENSVGYAQFKIAPNAQVYFSAFNAAGSATIPFNIRGNPINFQMYDGTNVAAITPTGVAITGTVTVNGTAVSLAGHTHSYLPLSGGTIAGNLAVAFTGAPLTVNSTNNNGNKIVMQDNGTNVGYFGAASTAPLWVQNPAGEMVLQVHSSKNVEAFGVVVSKGIYSVGAATLLGAANSNMTLTMRPAGTALYSILEMQGLANASGLQLLAASGTGYYNTNSHIFRNYAGSNYATLGSTGLDVVVGTIKQNGTAVSLVGHTHAFADLTAKPTTLAGYGITDGLTTSYVPSWASVSDKPTTFAPSAHSHVIGDVTGLQTALDGKQPNLSYGTSGAWWGKAAQISGDGVLEVGKYIDFHDASAGTTDFDFRLTSGGGTLYASGPVNVTGLLYTSTNVQALGNIYVGSTLWINTDKALLQHDGTNGYLRTQTGSFHLGAGANTTFSLYTDGGALLTGSFTTNANLICKSTSYIQGAAPTQWWQDSDHRAFGIHVNSDTAYFMRGGINDPVWSALANGQWPMSMNLNTGKVVMGNDLQVFGNLFTRDIYADRGDGTGVIFLSNTGRYLYWDTANYHLPSGSLIVGGNITASSDIRFKRDIRPLEDHNRIFDGLHGYRYHRDGREQIGFLAQEVEKELPEAVITDLSEDAYKSVDIYPIVATLIEQVRELKARVAELEAR